jgi:hypothetical protein
MLGLPQNRGKRAPIPAGISIAEEILAQIARVKERTISFLNERSGGSM